MSLLVDLNLGWKKLVMSPKDFVALVEIMDRSTVVDQSYLSKTEKYVLVREGKQRAVHAETCVYPTVSQLEYDELTAQLSPENEAVAA